MRFANVNRMQKLRKPLEYQFLYFRGFLHKNAAQVRDQLRASSFATQGQGDCCEGFQG